MAPWGWGEGRKKYFFLSLIFYEQYFYLSTLLNSNKKTSVGNIDLNWFVTVLKQSLNLNRSRFG
jgi:hypothetical protein